MKEKTQRLQKGNAKVLPRKGEELQVAEKKHEKTTE